MNKKKILLALIGLSTISFVLAGTWVVSTMNVIADVKEPFSHIEYAIVNPIADCSSLPYDYYSPVDGDVNFGGFYAGESGKICFSIENEANADIPFTILGEVLTGYGNYQGCSDSLGAENSIIGNAVAEDITYSEFLMEANPGVAPIDDCHIKFSVERG